MSWEGSKEDGKEQGRGAIVYEDGRRDEGEMVAGVRVGKWVETKGGNLRGERREGEYVNGKRQGQWIWTKPDGSRKAAEYDNGTRVSVTDL